MYSFSALNSSASTTATRSYNSCLLSWLSSQSRRSTWRRGSSGSRCPTSTTRSSVISSRRSIRVNVYVKTIKRVQKFIFIAIAKRLPSLKYLGCNYCWACPGSSTNKTPRKSYLVLLVSKIFLTLHQVLQGVVHHDVLFVLIKLMNEVYSLVCLHYSSKNGNQLLIYHI